MYFYDFWWKFIIIFYINNFILILAKKYKQNNASYESDNNLYSWIFKEVVSTLSFFFFIEELMTDTKVRTYHVLISCGVTTGWGCVYA